MEIDIKLNIGTLVLLGVINVLGYGLYKQTKKVKSLTNEIEAPKEMKGENMM